MTMKKTALLAAALALAATVSVADAQRVDLKAARESLLAADRAHGAASGSGLVEGFTGALADSVVFLPPRSAVITGREAVRGYLSGTPLFTRLSWEPVRADVSADGTVGYTLGLGSGALQDGTTMHARLISVWRREADGAWKVVAIVPSLNPDAPRPVPAGFGTPADNGVAGAGRGGAAAATAAVMQADRDFAALSAARNAGVAFAAFAAPTGVVMGGPEYGPAEIGRSFEDAPAGVALNWGPILGGAAESGDLGYTVGLATTTTPEGPRYSKYVTVWQRQPDGGWKYVADGGTSRPAPAQ